jgi:hypothetical protein
MMAAVPQENGRAMYDGQDKSTVAMRYDALARRVTHWMLANPGKPLTHCAREFKVTPQYLYYFVSSDTFKAKYAELAGGDFQEAFMTTLSEKLRGGAMMAVDRLVEQVELSPSAEFVLDASEVLINAALKMDGPRPINQTNIQNNFPVIPADVLASVQHQMLTGASPASVLVENEAPSARLSAAE